MGADKRIPCAEVTFETLRREKEAGEFTWDGYLQFLYVCRDRHADIEAFEPADTGVSSDTPTTEMDLEPILNRIDELPEETARKTVERLQR